MGRNGRVWPNWFVLSTVTVFRVHETATRAKWCTEDVEYGTVSLTHREDGVVFQLTQSAQTVGQVLDSGMKLYRTSLSKVFPLTLMYGLIAAIPTFIAPMGISDVQNQSFPPENLKWFFVISVTTGLLSNIFLLATVRMLWGIAQETPVAAGVALTTGIRKFPAFFAATMLYSVAVIVGFILLIVPGVYLAGQYCMYMMAVVGENRGPIASLSRSRALVAGMWWRTTTVLTVGILIYMVLALAAGFMGGIALSVLGGGERGGMGSILEVLIHALIYALAAPVSLAIFVVQFFDLRLRKEGGDLQARLDAV